MYMKSLVLSGMFRLLRTASLTLLTFSDTVYTDSGIPGGFLFVTKPVVLNSPENCVKRQISDISH